MIQAIFIGKSAKRGFLTKAEPKEKGVICSGCGLTTRGYYYKDTDHGSRYDTGCALWMEKKYGIDLF